MADRTTAWRALAATSAIGFLADIFDSGYAPCPVRTKRKPAPSTPTSKRAKVKAARKQRQRNG